MTPWAWAVVSACGYLALAVSSGALFVWEDRRDYIRKHPQDPAAARLRYLQEDFWVYPVIGFLWPVSLPVLGLAMAWIWYSGYLGKIAALPTKAEREAGRRLAAQRETRQLQAENERLRASQDPLREVQ